ncbi:hypothetical protein Btru_070303 [Bulinus truncatus]|nr:hypothetical protein Btru_070303 [Bulinus truncatus]
MLIIKINIQTLICVHMKTFSVYCNIGIFLCLYMRFCKNNLILNFCFTVLTYKREQPTPSTMTSLLTYLGVSAAVTMVTAVYNVDFCNRNIGTINSTGQRQQEPQFFGLNNFYVFLETKDDSRSVSYSEMYYSEDAGLVYGTQISPTSRTQIWMDTQYDEVMVVPLDKKSSCIDTKFDQSPLFSMTRAQIVNGSVKLQDPSVVFGWDYSIKRNVSFLGESRSRGIDTQRWILCEYYPGLDITYVITWDIVDASRYRLPVETPSDAEYVPVLPISSSTLMLNGSGYEVRVDTDYTHFSKIQTNDRHFEIPADMLCANKPNSQKPLPVIPDYFKYRAEQVTFLDYNNVIPQPPNLVYSAVEYRKIMGLYIQDYITTPQRGNPNDKSYIRVVDDYNTGVSYSLDLTSGACTVTSISGNRNDAYQLSSGLVRMRNSDEFFDLDSKQYQYMGVHRVREIDCDTWSAYMNSNQPDHAQNTMYTWYFASADWQKKTGYRNPGVMPVMLQLEQDSTLVQFHIYEFSTDPNKWFPDLSTCYTPNNTMNVEVFLKVIQGLFCQWNKHRSNLIIKNQ